MGVSETILCLPSHSFKEFNLFIEVLPECAKLIFVLIRFIFQFSDSMLKEVEVRAESLIIGGNLVSQILARMFLIIPVISYKVTYEFFDLPGEVVERDSLLMSLIDDEFNLIDLLSEMSLLLLDVLDLIIVIMALSNG